MGLKGDHAGFNKRDKTVWKDGGDRIGCMVQGLGMGIDITGGKSLSDPNLTMTKSVMTDITGGEPLSDPKRARPQIGQG